MSGILSIVATPIGNLGDITIRAVETLKSVDIIAAEDSRVARRLLNHLQISAKLFTYHEHNEIAAAEKLNELLLSGKNIALTSDAGTPCISDPGYRIVNLARKNGIKVVTIPGASSIMAALSISGLPTDHFYFEGFLPRKKGRRTHLEFISSLEATVVIFESPFRLLKTLTDFSEYAGNRIVSVCRELTKIYEETFFGTIEDALKHFSDQKIKGEIVILMAKKDYKI